MRPCHFRPHEAHICTSKRTCIRPAFFSPPSSSNLRNETSRHVFSLLIPSNIIRTIKEFSGQNTHFYQGGKKAAFFVVMTAASNIGGRPRCLFTTFLAVYIHIYTHQSILSSTPTVSCRHIMRGHGSEVSSFDMGRSTFCRDKYIQQEIDIQVPLFALERKSTPTDERRGV